MSFQSKFSETYTLPPKTHHKNRLKHALLSTGHQPTWERIEECSVRKRCDSYYCQGCRTRMVRSQSIGVIERHREFHGNDEGLARANMRFVTVLHDLVPIGHKSGGAGGTQSYNNFTDTRKSSESLKRRLASVRKEFSGLQTTGRIEYEVVNTSSIIDSGLCAKKASVMKHMIERNRGGHDVMIHVHVHFIMFLNGHDSDAVKAFLKRKWPGKNMVRVEPFHTNKTIVKNINNLCSYMVKDKMSYNHGMNSVDGNNGKLFDDCVLSYLVRLCLCVGSSKMSIWSKKGVNLGD